MLKSTAIAIAIALAFGSLPAAAYEPAKGISANGLFRICGASDPIWIGACYGYVLAIAETFDTAGTRFCIGDVEPKAIVEAIRSDLHGQTDLHFMPAAQAAVMTLDKHFRC